MTQYFDNLEVRDPEVRTNSQFTLLPGLIRRAKSFPGWAEQLKYISPEEITSWDALATLPVLRKSELSDLQKQRPPLGGFASPEAGDISRLFESPGPIFEPQGASRDFWRATRALFAAGFRSGDVAHNTFSYHLTPGGWILDSALRSLGCQVIPAGTGNTEQQISAITQFRPDGYVGVPDFLKILLEKMDDAGVESGSIRKAFVSGGALFPSLREYYKDRGIQVFQGYATADVGMIAYESEALEGMIIDEGCLVEIVRPGTGTPVEDGEVGEVVVTSFNRTYPMIRLATGDLSSILEGPSPCGRTNRRIKGWMGRADQTTKIKGMFVHPSQVAEIGKQHPELGKLRLVVSREGETDKMTLQAETAGDVSADVTGIEETVKQVTKLSSDVELIAAGTLPNDGLVIADKRDYET